MGDRRIPGPLVYSDTPRYPLVCTSDQSLLPHHDIEIVCLGLKKHGRVWMKTSNSVSEMYFLQRPEISPHIMITHIINTFSPGRNCCHFADGNSKCILWNKNVRFLFSISLHVVPKVGISNIPALVHIMAWHPPANKPLSKAMVVSLLAHVCVTYTQWIKGFFHRH